VRKVTQVYALERLAFGDITTARNVLAAMVKVWAHPHEERLG
jgi:hypothetical protein